METKIKLISDNGGDLGRSGLSLLERCLPISPRYLILWLCVIFVLIALFYLPHQALYAIHFYKIHVYMGNRSASLTTTTKANKSSAAIMSALTNSTKPLLHFKCRAGSYPRNESIVRFPVPDDKVPWSVSYPEYAPPDYTAQSVLDGPVWADKDVRKDPSIHPKWNEVDGKVDRSSFTGRYDLEGGVPRNPVGRTGVTGRGCLGRWGPNHAADPIVTRWKRSTNGEKIPNKNTGKNILQFIAVQRRDTGEWAIPGGMVDPGENVSVTLKREFSEEAMNSIEAKPEEKRQIEQNVSQLFNEGQVVYKGYVDDPRNTDNSWMETVAVNFHDETGQSVGRFQLHAGDDAVGVRWTDLNKKLNLYASHSHFVEQIAKLRDAHWG